MAVWIRNWGTAVGFGLRHKGARQWGRAWQRAKLKYLTWRDFPERRPAVQVSCVESPKLRAVPCLTGASTVTRFRAPPIVRPHLSVSSPTHSFARAVPFCSCPVSTVQCHACGCCGGQGRWEGSFRPPPLREHTCHRRLIGTQNATGKQPQNTQCSTDLRALPGRSSHALLPFRDCCLLFVNDARTSPGADSMTTPQAEWATVQHFCCFLRPRYLPTRGAPPSAQVCLWRGHSVYQNRPLFPPSLRQSPTGPNDCGGHINGSFPCPMHNAALHL